jgi:hypothetical protein
MEHFRHLLSALLVLCIFPGCDTYVISPCTSDADCERYMSTPYTPTPAPLPATLDLPEDGVEAVQVETVNTNTSALADAIKQQETVIRAWVTLDNITKSIGAPFVVELVSSYPSGAWTVVDSLGIQVPEPGMYEVALVSTMQHETGEGSFVQVAFGYGASMVGSFTVIGFASGYSYDATNAIPARVVGSVPHIPVTTPATTRFVLLPASAGDMTPVVETEQPGQLHQFVITKIGELP